VKPVSQASRSSLAGRLAVGARHDETVEPALLELGAQRSDAGGALRRPARIVE
jgi:hypothetical protein